MIPFKRKGKNARGDFVSETRAILFRLERQKSFDAAARRLFKIAGHMVTAAETTSFAAGLYHVYKSVTGPEQNIGPDARHCWMCDPRNRSTPRARDWFRRQASR